MAESATSLAEVRSLIEEARFEEAEARARELLVEAELREGIDSMTVARILDLLVTARLDGGAFEETQELAARAVSIKEKKLQPDDAELALSLKNLADILQWKELYAEARPIYERCLAIAEKSLPPYDRTLLVDLERSVTALGNLHYMLGEYEEAKTFYQRALAIKEEAAGCGPAEVGVSYYNLGLVHTMQSDYAGARPHFERALALEKEKLEVDPSDRTRYLIYLNGLGFLLYQIADYAGARTQFEEVLAVREEILGPEHLDVASILNNLGLLLRNTGDYAVARKRLERAARIREDALGDEHSLVAQSLHNLGVLLSEMGHYGEALPFLRRALEIERKVLPEGHDRIGTTLQNLADLLVKMEDYEGARPLYEQALKIWEGPEDPQDETAWCLNGLGVVNERAGNPEAAEDLFRQALDIRTRILGADHPRVAETSLNLGALLAGMGRLAEAADLALRAETISREHVLLTARTLPERQALRYASIRTTGLDLALSIALGTENVALERGVLDAIIRSRALVLDEMASRHQTAGRSSDPEVERLWEKLVFARTQLARLTVQGPDPHRPAQYLAELETARDKKESAERTLAEKSLAFRTEQARRKVGLDEVSRRIPKDSAVVAYVLFNQHHIPATGRANSSERRTSRPVPSYAVFILQHGDPHPTVLSLGPAKEIDAAIEAWRAEVAGGAARRQLHRDPIVAYRTAGERLRAEIWDPVEGLLEDKPWVFLIPDSALHLVSFAALPVGERGFLVEREGWLHVLSAERDLLVYPAEHEKRGGLLVLGAPTFSQAPGHSAGTAAGAKTRGTFRGARSACVEFRDAFFDELPSAFAEVKEIARLWRDMQGSEPGRSAVELTGSEATESAFKTHGPGKQILHLATHGFFLGDTCPAALAGSRGIGKLSTAEEGPPAGVTGENPLLLSGLALAGANRREKTGPDEEDGILTAEEIAALDLEGVSWAVLSACDTGRGEIQTGEGVFGLRRAFHIAGAETVIMSLWSVEDASTRAWMRSLYEARLKRGLETAEAVREASLEVLRERRKNGLSTHPFFWAGFVAAGNWS